MANLGGAGEVIKSSVRGCEARKKRVRRESEKGGTSSLRDILSEKIRRSGRRRKRLRNEIKILRRRTRPQQRRDR